MVPTRLQRQGPFLQRRSFRTLTSLSAISWIGGVPGATPASTGSRRTIGSLPATEQNNAMRRTSSSSIVWRQYSAPAYCWNFSKYTAWTHGAGGSLHDRLYHVEQRRHVLAVAQRGGGSHCGGKSFWAWADMTSRASVIRPPSSPARPGSVAAAQLAFAAGRTPRR